MVLSRKQLHPSGGVGVNTNYPLAQEGISPGLCCGVPAVFPEWAGLQEMLPCTALLEQEQLGHPLCLRAAGGSCAGHLPAGEH